MSVSDLFLRDNQRRVQRNDHLRRELTMRRLLFDGAQIELGLLPVVAALAPVGTIPYVKVGGVWLTATAYIKVGGVWKLATPFTRQLGTWY